MGLKAQLIIHDPDGGFMLNAMRTGLGLILGILAYQFMNFGMWGIYSILMGIFAVQMIIGQKILVIILSAIANTVLLTIAVIIGSKCPVMIQIPIVALLASYSIYLFSIQIKYGLVCLFVTLFLIIAKGLTVDFMPTISQLIPPLFIGGICSFIPFLVIPKRTSSYYIRNLPHVLLNEIGNNFYWIGSLPPISDFSNLSPKLKHKTFSYQVRVSKLFQSYIKTKKIMDSHDKFTSMTSMLVEGAITLTYWPNEHIGKNDFLELNKIKKVYFSEIGEFLCTQNFTSQQSRNKYEKIVAILNLGSNSTGNSPSIRLFFSVLLGMIEQCRFLVIPEDE